MWSCSSIAIWAVSLTVPGLLGAIRASAIIPTAFTPALPMLQVRVLPLCDQHGSDAYAANDVPAGIVSVITTPVATSGPVFPYDIS